MERPIIINETDVSKCPAYRIDGFCAATGINTTNYCEDSPQCLYKELQREKTNNQSLRNEVEAIQKKLDIATEALNRIFSNSVNCDGMDCCDCNDKHCNTYIAKKALERIKE